MMIIAIYIISIYRSSLIDFQFAIFFCMPSAGGHGCIARRFVDRLVQTGAALAVIEKRRERAAAKQAWVADVSAPRPGRAGL